MIAVISPLITMMADMPRVRLSGKREKMFADFIII